MEYAIVDIETTGGHPSGNGMTEIAIIVHNGKEITHRFESLINPLQAIPLYITALTGIDNDMVAQSPPFAAMADEVYHLLQGRIFVAHNVNFDYSFVKQQLKDAGHELTAHKLCTVRMSRKILPSQASYSLGRLCRSLNIPHANAHRAMGDAKATACLFSLLLEKDTQGHIMQMLKKNSREQLLPPHLNRADVEMLPQCPGVYYFKEKSGKVIYVGKAKNLKKRVVSHFSGHNPSPQRQHFLKEIHQIAYEIAGTELMALVHEAEEIKRIWPLYNRAIKKPEPKFGIYQYLDQNGYQRLIVDKHKRNQEALYTLNKQVDGINLLRKLCAEFNLCPRMCLLQKKCTNAQGCACDRTVSIVSYNLRVRQATNALRQHLPNFAICGAGRSENEKSCILVQNGALYGMGYMDMEVSFGHSSQVKQWLTPYTSSDYIMQLIMRYAEEHPQHVIPMT